MLRQPTPVGPSTGIALPWGVYVLPVLRIGVVHLGYASRNSFRYRKGSTQPARGQVGNIQRQPLGTYALIGLMYPQFPGVSQNNWLAMATYTRPNVPGR